MSIQDPAYATEGAFALPQRAWSMRSPSASRLAGPLGLGGLITATLVAVLAAARTPALLPQTIHAPAASSLVGPFAGTGLALHGFEVIALLALMLACYVLAVGSAGRVSARSVVVALLLIYGLVLLAPPLFSTDLFGYQMYGRMGALHGLNPYLNGPHAAANDPLYPLVGFRWIHTPTSYGPLFTLISYGLAPLSVAASAFAYKGIAVLATLLGLLFVWKGAELRRVDPQRAVALVGLNPLVFLYGAGGAHNDLLMMLALAAGVYLALARRPAGGGALIVTAAAVKLTGALTLPFALAADGRQAAVGRRKMAGGAVAATTAFALLGFGLFGSGLLHLPGTLTGVQHQSGGRSFAHLIVGALGASSARGAIALALGIVSFIVSAWLLREVWNGRMQWITAAGWATFTVLVTAFWLVPWYIAWLLPLAALSADRRLWQASLLLTAALLAINMADYIS